MLNYVSFGGNYIGLTSVFTQKIPITYLLNTLTFPVNETPLVQLVRSKAVYRHKLYMNVTILSFNKSTKVGPSHTDLIHWHMLLTTLLCVSTTPFGSPVVPLE